MLQIADYRLVSINLKVAAAILEWSKDRGASLYCHWFQPIGSSGVRHGLSAQVQQSMFEFDAAGKPVWNFKGKVLLKGAFKF